MNDLVTIVESILPGISSADAILLFMLIFTRWIVMTMAMPFLGSQLLPSPVRVALAAVLSLVSFYALLSHAPSTKDYSMVYIALLFFKEAIIGFILGFLASLIFYVYEFFGEILDIARAASMSRVLVPELKHQSSAMGVLLFQLSLVLFVSCGFHRDVINNAVKSFYQFPVHEFVPTIFSEHFLALSLEIMSQLFATALCFALPVVVIAFLIDLAFGLMNRVAPQINAYFLSLPAKMLGGLIMLFFLLPFLLDEFADHYRNFSHFLEQLIKAA